MFDIPPLFRIIREESRTEWDEMYEVFNMGHRFDIYTRKEDAGPILDLAREFNVEAQIIGHVEEYKGRKLSIVTKEGTFHY